jgi:DNA-binding beta-propeller fold protein YncE
VPVLESERRAWRGLRASRQKKGGVMLRRILPGATIALLVLAGSWAGANGASALSLRGTVESGGTGVAGYEVSLYASFVRPFGFSRVLGRDATGPLGEFEIDYRLPPGVQPLLFVRAERGPSMLASAIGRAPVGGPATVNERTTVATGFAFAQFVDRSAIRGNRYGMLNAVHMTANMVDPETGGMAAVLRLPPNGEETTALRTFNSLANMVAYCTASEAGCEDLFDATTLPGGPRPGTVLEAVANIAKYPWLNVADLFRLSFERPVYGPALAKDQQPPAWALFLKFTGSFSSVQDENNLMNGPGTFAIDRQGFLWVNDNYVPEPPEKPACAGMRLLKFYPWGENFPGSPYFGGGLSGAGWGISIAPNGRIWVGNFGFAGVGCPTPPADSVSVFKPDGTPSRFSPFTSGPISWPQGTVPDRKGTIWIANCAADSVTLYPKGRPQRATSMPIPAPEKVKPFGIAIDHGGNAWVTGSFDSSLTVFGPDGDLIEHILAEDPLGRTQLSRPMGIASDSRGNIWVANSDFMDVPCPPDIPDLGSGTDPSIALFLRHPHRRPHGGSPFSGGGLTVPWGIAVDGNDTVWVANFGFPFDLGDPESSPAWEEPNRVSHFCGADKSKCPLTKQRVGMPISPEGTGYSSDALIRNTGIAIDPSGNVWLTNNWKEIPILRNPGGNSIVVLVGAAAPVRTPLIGTPRSFAR